MAAGPPVPDGGGVVNALQLGPAARFRLTNSMAHNHAAGCRSCAPPSLDRVTAGCPEGRRLEQQWLRHWRALIDALSDRRVG